MDSFQREIPRSRASITLDPHTGGAQKKVSDFAFANLPMDVALPCNISKVVAAAHMPFISWVGPAFFGKQSM
ncbi:putative component of type VI protein secretion system [Burkholderia sp. 567]